MTVWPEVEKLVAEIRARVLCDLRYFELNKGTLAQQYIEHFNEILNNVTSCMPVLRNLSMQMVRFDYDLEHRGNGYRSLFNYYKRMLEKILIIVDKITKQKSSISFGTTKSEICGGIKSWVKLSTQMNDLLKLGCIYLDNVVENNLFIPLNESTSALGLEIADKVAYMDAFLGCPLGFQYAESLSHLSNVGVSLTAAYTDISDPNDKLHSLTDTLLSSSYKYMFDPETRANKAHEALMNADVTFCKTMWEFTSTESLQTPTHKPLGNTIRLKNKSIIVNKENRKNYNITTFTECLEILLPQNADDVNVKCIGDCIRESMLEKLGPGEMESETRAPSTLESVDTIMFHIHGGGCIANDSQSHEVFLRMWTMELGIPIFSVQYSLAPEATFPQPLEECYYAYAWMLENRPLGWSGKNVVLAGDSSGGNLVTSLAIKCVMTNLKLPRAIFAFYPALNITTHRSPSRLLSAIDPILNMSTAQICALAYCGIDVDESTEKDARGAANPVLASEDRSNKDKKNLHAAEQLKKRFSALMNYSKLNDPLLSPVLADEAIFHHFPFTYIFASECDPLLDDSVTLAKILRKVGTKHELLIIPDVPHGFLSFCQSSTLCLQVSTMATKIMKSIIKSFDDS